MEQLTTKQIRFVEEYIRNGGNGKQAAISAGYSENTAESQASRMLRKVKVQNALKERRSQIQQELRDYFIGDALTARKVMVQILNDPEATHKDKLTAAKDLLDRAGFKPTEKQEISGKDGGALQIVFVEPD
jgi:phage terminase small subunit